MHTGKTRFEDLPVTEEKLQHLQVKLLRNFRNFMSLKAGQINQNLDKTQELSPNHTIWSSFNTMKDKLRS